MNRKTKLALLLPVALLVSCLNNVNIDTSKIVTVEIRPLSESVDSSGTKKIARTDSNLLPLLEWINSNSRNWRKYYVTEPVGLYLVQANGILLNVGQDWAILTNTENSEDHTYSLKDRSSANELAGIIHALYKS